MRRGGGVHTRMARLMAVNRMCSRHAYAQIQKKNRKYLGPLQIKSELLFQAFVLPKDMSNQTIIFTLCNPYLLKKKHEKDASDVGSQAYLQGFVTVAYGSARNQNVT